MGEIMGRVITMSVQAGILILALLLIKQLAKKHISPTLGYALWLLPALRLLLPFTFESRASVLNLVQAGALTGAQQTAPVISSAPVSGAFTPAPVVGSAPAATQPVITGAIQPGPASGTAVTPADIPAVNAAAGVMDILFLIWICGMATALLYMLFVNIRFYIAVYRERTALELPMKTRVYSMQGLSSPCLCGFFRPFILVNDAALMSERTFRLVVRHELCHKRQGDQWWGLLRNLCCIVHWFNPLVWWAAVRSRTDCELSCDARVMKGFSQQQCESYGMALLSIIKSDGDKPNIINNTTTMASAGRELRERIDNIGKPPRRRALATLAVTLISAAVCLGACTGRVTAPPPADASGTPAYLQETAPQSPSPAPAVMQAPATRAPAAEPAFDLDGDGAMDTVVLEDYLDNRNNDDPHALLSVELGAGGSLSYRFDGYWRAVNLEAADFDGDGRTDILIFLESLGSNYGGGRPMVLRLGGNGLEEYPYDIIPGLYTLSAERIGGVYHADDYAIVCIGARVLTIDGRDLIRLRVPIDASTAWYTDFSWNGEGWTAENKQAGMAYSDEDDLLPAEPPSVARPEIPTTPREGYIPPEMIFVDGNPDAPDYDPAALKYLPTLREEANAAMMQLYDMTGINIERVYVKGGQFGVSFNLKNKNWGGHTFFFAGFADEGYCRDLSMAVAQEGVSYSPIKPEDIVMPENVQSMTRPELAKWYYENSTFGDRRAIVSADFGPLGDEMVRLYLKTGEFYEAWFNDASPMPYSWFGPYEAGFEH